VIFEILFALHTHQQKNIPAHPPEMVKNIGWKYHRGDIPGLKYIVALSKIKPNYGCIIH
jgi:hypothetical protein